MDNQINDLNYLNKRKRYNYFNKRQEYIKLYKDLPDDIQWLINKKLTFLDYFHIHKNKGQYYFYWRSRDID